MADDDKKDEQELSEDEKLAAEWEADVRAAPMEEFPEGSKIAPGTGPAPDLDVILDIPVTISMEVGNTQIPIRNLLQLNQGSVIELDRLAGEPLDVLVNGTLIAHGGNDHVEPGPGFDGGDCHYFRVCLDCSPHERHDRWQHPGHESGVGDAHGHAGTRRTD